MEYVVDLKEQDLKLLQEAYTDDRGIKIKSQVSDDIYRCSVEYNFIFSALNHIFKDVREVSVRCLGCIGDKKTVPLLIRLLSVESDDKVRDEIVEALRQIDPAIYLLLRNLKHKFHSVQVMLEATVRLYKTGYRDGYFDGSNQGFNGCYSYEYEDEHADEHEDMYDKGYEEEFNKGHEEFDEGYTEGYDTGYEEGYGKGHVEGYDKGYARGTKGYDKGYERGTIKDTVRT